MKKIAVALAFTIYLLAVAAILAPVNAQVPITVWGYVKMPDGSPAVGASVTVKAADISKTVTTDSSGKYKVDLTVPSVPVKVTVTAKKGRYRGSASKVGEGVIRIDVVLKYSPPPKKSTSIELSVDKNEYVVGDVVVVKGYIKPAMSVTVTITIVKPDGTSVSDNIKTQNDGSFTYSFIVDKTGIWKIQVKYAGSSEYAGSSSPVVEIVVKEKAYITMSAIATELGKVIVEGVVEPPISGATVMVYVSLDGGNTWLYLLNTTTDENGHYRAELEFTVGGNMLFKAIFPGTQTVTYCETEAPPAIKLPTPGEEELKKKEEELKKKLTELENENVQLKEKVKELTEKLEEAQQTIEELSTTVATLESGSEKLKTATFIGIPLAAITCTVVGLLLGKRIAKVK